ncbi:MAG: desulfoferrodoxin family protein, partial [Planctomycetota bacterium]|nr:desulfoferrodoxin family protein [Planctomycetota bacterium]
FNDSCAGAEKPGTLIATSYCNIHGLWENQVRIEF